MTKTERKRQAMPPEERRRIILDAALTVFAEKGFANARIEDIARLAGIGKGTVYLYFSDKQALFMGLISAMMTPMLDRAGDFVAQSHLSARETLSVVYGLIEAEILSTRKRDLLRLVVTEMGNFPELAAYYHQNLVGPGLSLLKTLLERAGRTGELRSAAVLDAPQIVFSPIVMSVVWDMLFQPYGTFNARAAFAFMLDSLFSPAEGAEQ
ncbi:TetR/AcrR family transcriptional regulator [Martelella alba]|uniref:TetR/AcrR family transcriptional regulator n=1 Tax=Martelella alba TaxID=2590451 RepID=UPI0015E857D8|nr:TetR/AcrR family transcriptional regulator [Martelella alba]